MAECSSTILARVSGLMFPPQMPAVQVLAHKLQVTKLAVDDDVLVYLLVSGQFALFFVTLSALVTNEVAIFGVNNLVVSLSRRSR